MCPVYQVCQGVQGVSDLTLMSLTASMESKGDSASIQQQEARLARRQQLLRRLRRQPAVECFCGEEEGYPRACPGPCQTHIFHCQCLLKWVTRDIEDIDIEDRNIDKRTCLLCHSAFDKIMITKTCFGEETMETVDVKERM